MLIEISGIKLIIHFKYFKNYSKSFTHSLKYLPEGTEKKLFSGIKYLQREIYTLGWKREQEIQLMIHCTRTLLLLGTFSLAIIINLSYWVKL